MADTETSRDPLHDVDPLVSTRQTVALTSLSKTTLWRLERKGDFPQRIQVSDGRCAWRLSEVKGWIDERDRESRPAA